MTVEETHTATELLNNALNDTPLPVLTRSVSIMPEPVEHKITHDKPFNEIWGYAQDIMRTIPNAVKYNVVPTDLSFNSGRQKFICSFYNKNHDLLEKHLATLENVGGVSAYGNSSGNSVSVSGNSVSVSGN